MTDGSLEVADQAAAGLCGPEPAGDPAADGAAWETGPGLPQVP
jgi:hypothetical protein